MSTWREGGREGEEEGVGEGEQGCKRSREAREARELGGKREKRGQEAPFIVSGHWGGAYLAIAR